MDKEFVTYEQAVALNELKYDGDYNYTYTVDKHLWYGDVKADGVSTLAAPLKQQVFRWFREKYNILHALVVPIKITASDKEGYRYSWEIIDEQEEYIVDDSLLGYYSYDEAENACIDKLIELVNN
jgi:hypothetical protein